MFELVKPTNVTKDNTGVVHLHAPQKKKKRGQQQERGQSGNHFVALLRGKNLKEKPTFWDGFDRCPKYHDVDQALSTAHLNKTGVFFVRALQPSQCLPQRNTTIGKGRQFDCLLPATGRKIFTLAWLWFYCPFLFPHSTVFPSVNSILHLCKLQRFVCNTLDLPCIKKRS